MQGRNFTMFHCDNKNNSRSAVQCDKRTHCIRYGLSFTIMRFRITCVGKLSYSKIDIEKAHRNMFIRQMFNKYSYETIILISRIRVELP